MSTKVRSRGCRCLPDTDPRHRHDEPRRLTKEVASYLTSTGSPSLKRVLRRGNPTIPSIHYSSFLRYPPLCVSPDESHVGCPHLVWKTLQYMTFISPYPNPRSRGLGESLLPSFSLNSSVPDTSVLEKFITF